MDHARERELCTALPNYGPDNLISPPALEDGYSSACDSSGLSHAEKVAGAWGFAEALGGTVILFVYCVFTA